MPATRNSRTVRISDLPSRAHSSGAWWDTVLAALALALLSAAAGRFVQERGYTLYYGDAEAHLNHARRLIDSRTPGLDQLGTVWLPLPHLLALPLVSDDRLWHSGLAGAIPSAVLRESVPDLIGDL